VCVCVSVCVRCYFYFVCANLNILTSDDNLYQQYTGIFYTVIFLRKNSSESSVQSRSHGPSDTARFRHGCPTFFFQEKKSPLDSPFQSVWLGVCVCVCVCCVCVCVCVCVG